MSNVPRRLVQAQTARRRRPTEQHQKGMKDLSKANPNRHRNIHAPKIIDPGGNRKSQLGGGKNYSHYAPLAQEQSFMYGSAKGQAQYNARKQRTLS